MNTFVRILMTGMLMLALRVSAAAQYRILDSLALEGETGWDYLTVDTSAHRLYVSRGTHVQVVDLQNLAKVGDIPNTNGVHGIALVPKAGHGYTSNGRDSSITMFDLKSLQTIATIHIDARNPDAIVYEPVSGRIFTLNGGSENSTVVDVATNHPVKTIPLGGKPEFAVADGKGLVFVNIENTSELVVIDARTMLVVKRWSISPGEEPSGLAFDPVHRRLFSVCGNRLMVVSDADQGKVVATVPIGGGVDGAAFDAGVDRAFSSNGEGTMTIVRGEGSEKYTPLKTLATRRGARTVVLDPSTHRLYTVAASFAPPPPATAEQPHPRPSIVPGSVRLYVIGS